MQIPYVVWLGHPCPVVRVRKPRTAQEWRVNHLQRRLLRLYDLRYVAWLKPVAYQDRVERCIRRVWARLRVVAAQ